MARDAALLADVPALVRTGFPGLGTARYLLLRIAAPARARAWLAGLPVADAAQVGRDRAPLGRVIQLAFTAAGLRRLGWAEEALAAFAPEFLAGMAGDERRSHRLGDAGPNAPDRWDWGVGEREPHVLLVLLGAQAEGDAWMDRLAAAAGEAGCTPLTVPASCSQAEDGRQVREPFGFADGLSQPELAWPGERAADAAGNSRYRNRIALGEILLGHRNEYGFVPDYPTAPPLGRNGSYLVYRQLAQDVDGFWRWAAAAAGPDGAGRLAERMVGRARDGAALVPADATGGFAFDDDPEGRLCPLGSHVRRASPRTGDAPPGRRGPLGAALAGLGLVGAAERDAIASARFHRLLRRGRSYENADEAGLHFLCLNASLARQFEFVQGAWLASSAFGGLGGAQDPLLGNRCPLAPDPALPAAERAAAAATDAFAWHDAAGVPRLAAGLPPFVRVRGGAYFFLPGMKGLRLILGGPE